MTVNRIDTYLVIDESFNLITKDQLKMIIYLSSQELFDVSVFRFLIAGQCRVDLVWEYNALPRESYSVIHAACRQPLYIVNCIL